MLSLNVRAIRRSSWCGAYTCGNGELRRHGQMAGVNKWTIFIAAWIVPIDYVSNMQHLQSRFDPQMLQGMCCFLVKQTHTCVLDRGVDVCGFTLDLCKRRDRDHSNVTYDIRLMWSYTSIVIHLIYEITRVSLK